MSEKQLTVGGLFSGIQSEAGNSASNGQVCRCFGTVSPTPTPEPCSSAIGRACRSTPMCARCGLPMSCQSTCSPAASPARTSASPAAAPGSEESGRVFGPKCSGSLASFDPATCSWRTSQLSLLEDSTLSSPTLPRSGSMQSGTVYEHRTSALLTAESESGLWPTPVAHDDGKTPEAHMAMKARMPGGERKTITSLAVMVKAVERGLWPTPRATDDDKGGRGDLLAMVRTGKTSRRREWATPTAHPRTHTPRQVHHGEQLANQIGGPLNPRWVEWLMGFPVGWTSSDALVTPSSRRSRNGSAGGSSSKRKS
jgi:hypothetical protein